MKFDLNKVAQPKIGKLSFSIITSAILGFLSACSGADTQIQDHQNPINQLPAELSSQEKTDIPTDIIARHEALYLERYNRMIEVFSTGAKTSSLYDNLAPVAGVSNPVFFPNAKNSLLKPETINAAITYAGERNSEALIVIKDGEILLEHYFEEASAASKINGKSFAKPLGVVAVGRAISEGHIKSLDQRAADFLTEWEGTSKADITIRQLLGMRSGLHHQSFSPTPEDIMNRAYLHPRHEHILINEYTLLHEPGTRYDYSNANAELIAPLLARATGQSYEQWVSQQILSLLSAAGGEIWLNRDKGVAHSGCCILLPAQSFAKVGQLLLQDGVWNGTRLLPEGYVAQMRKPTNENQNAGLGVYLGNPFTQWRGAHNPDLEKVPTYHSAPYEADDLFLFDGNSNQVLYMVPSKNLLILRMGGTPSREFSRELAWDNAFLPNLILKELQN